MKTLLSLVIAAMLLYDPWAGAVAVQVGFLVATRTWAT